ncbi:MAG: hypothetical protein ACYCUM_05525 [Solirubrobacteraceae bacterium]
MTLLPEVEHVLLDAIARDHAATRRGRIARIRARSLRLPALVALALLGTTTIALAASGVILTGSAVPTHGHQRPGYGYGVPVRGGSELLPLRVADPAGGLPWGMRVIHTSRGYLCVQIGRVDHGRLGELGIDGAFHGDGRFHPLPLDALPGSVGVMQGFDIYCEPPDGARFSAAIVGLRPSAASNPRLTVGTRQSRRTISFGLLGEHARAVRYRTEGGGTRTVEVLGGLGAYLIVQRATHGGRLGGIGSSLAEEGKPVSPDGALTAITYAYGGRTCTDTGHNDALRACGLREAPAPKPAPLPIAHVALHVQLEIRHHTVIAAHLVFHAPYAARSARQSYLVTSAGCGHSVTGGGTEHDLAKGALVRLSIGYALSKACSRSVKLSLSYIRSGHDSLGFTALGSTTVSIPHGDRARPSPHRMRGRQRSGAPRA